MAMMMVTERMTMMMMMMMTTTIAAIIRPSGASTRRATQSTQAWPDRAFSCADLRSDGGVGWHVMHAKPWCLFLMSLG